MVKVLLFSKTAHFVDFVFKNGEKNISERPTQSLVYVSMVLVKRNIV